ncbi:MAG: tyrosine-type recombinase/integrase, partial [Burkholderiaceae bacterium]
MALTEVQVRNAKPKDKAYKLADAKGLYLLVDANGRRYWRLKYRHLKKEKLLALGVYPEVSLGAARKKRDAARQVLDAGNDPSQERKHEKLAKLIRSENTFEAIAREWHAERRVGRWGGKPWVKGHADRVLVSLEQNIFPEIGHRPIAELGAAEILHAVRIVEKRGALEIAKRVMQRISSVYR